MGTWRKGVNSPARASPVPFPPPPLSPQGDTGSLFMWEESCPLVSRNSWALSPQLWLGPAAGHTIPAVSCGARGQRKRLGCGPGAAGGLGPVRLEEGPVGSPFLPQRPRWHQHWEVPEPCERGAEGPSFLTGFSSGM